MTHYWHLGTPLYQLRHTLGTWVHPYLNYDTLLAHGTPLLQL